ncbi:hypothetical protein OAA_08380 [Vibrio cyclitrophicus 1F175]|nr:hypothetical protein OA7_14225 [Vibrio cyclitrophicus 1F53]OEF66742.1 hypothetical protein OAA_08380 [Vibrio cyclitrophicus 1F175]OEF77707.1 hypothetical protein OA5_16820 [Vibrio cyclitrophicus 1F111]PMH29678.1 hypothetical protein BCU72_18800 [Vibrio cyclitrophicus]PMH79452.1 hypothetical protein BCU60_19715 [Vibrio cyclitrophicus]
MKNTSHINQVYPVMEVAFVVITPILSCQNKWMDLTQTFTFKLNWYISYATTWALRSSMPST